MKGSVGKFRSAAQNLGRITGELQEGVMKIRMVPISQIFSRFPAWYATCPGISERKSTSS